MAVDYQHCGVAEDSGINYYRRERLQVLIMNPILDEFTLFRARITAIQSGL